MPTYQVVHCSTYHFDSPVDNLGITCCLNPLELTRQKVESYNLVYQPLVSNKQTETDTFGNQTILLEFRSSLERVCITSVSTVNVQKKPETRSQGSGDNDVESFKWQELFDENVLNKIRQEAKHFIGDIINQNLDEKTLIESVMDKVHNSFVYDTTSTGVETPVLSLFSLQKGVCQDFARVTIAILQTIGIPTLYVSGYLYSAPNSGQVVHQVASHAWVSAFTDNFGWVDFDPTNNQWVDEHYITLARGRDYVDVIPVKGHVNNANKQRLKVSVTIEHLPDSTRRMA